MVFAAAALVLAAGLTAASAEPSRHTGALPNLHVRTRIPLQAFPSAIAYGANSIWVMTLDKTTLVRVDARNGRVVARIKLGAPPTTGFTDDEYEDWATFANGFVWVTDQANNTLYRVSPGSNRVVARTRIQSPSDVAVGFGSAWVPQFTPYKIARISETTNRVTTTLPANGPTSVAIGAGSVWVVAHRANTVLRINPANNSIVATIAPREAASLERATFGEGALWVSDNPKDTVDRIDPATNKAVVEIQLPGGHSYALADGGGYIWAIDFGGIYRIDPHTNTVTAEFTLRHAGRCGGSDRPPCLGLSIAYAHDSLWAADAITERLLRINPSG